MGHLAKVCAQTIGTCTTCAYPLSIESHQENLLHGKVVSPTKYKLRLLFLGMPRRPMGQLVMTTDPAGMWLARAFAIQEFKLVPIPFTSPKSKLCLNLTSPSSISCGVLSFNKFPCSSCFDGSMQPCIASVGNDFARALDQFTAPLCGFGVQLWGTGQ